MSTYVVLGATGNTGSIVAEKLLAAKHIVKVVGRNAEKLKALTDKGAHALIGDQNDVAFLTKAFEGAMGVYALIPPNYATNDFRAYQIEAGNKLAEAVQKSGVKYVVNLSSVGAHLSENSGVIVGLNRLERKFAENKNVNVLNLRAGFFMQNFLGNIGLIKGMNINGGFPINGNIKFGMIHTNDIGNYAAKRLLALDFSGHSHQDLSGERELTLIEATAVLGKAIGKPELPWVTFSYEDAKKGMMQAGLNENLATLFVEFAKCLNDGHLSSDFKHTKESTTPTSIEEFAKEFALAYNAS